MNLNVSTKKRTCCECETPFEFVVFDEIPDFCPVRCAKCQDVFAARVIADRRKQDARQTAEFAGISSRFLSYDKARDTQGYLPWIKANRLKSLFLAGDSGQGKTHCLGYAGYRSILDYGDHVMFLRLPEWLRATGALMGHDAYQAEREIGKAKTVGLLILDDLGKEKLTDRASEIVWDLIDIREREKRRTWISSNHNGKELRARLGEDKGETILVRLKRGYEEFR